MCVQHGRLLSQLLRPHLRLRPARVEHGLHIQFSLRLCLRCWHRLCLLGLCGHHNLLLLLPPQNAAAQFPIAAAGGGAGGSSSVRGHQHGPRGRGARLSPQPRTRGNGGAASAATANLRANGPLRARSRRIHRLPALLCQCQVCSHCVCAYALPGPLFSPPAARFLALTFRKRSFPHLWRACFPPGSRHFARLVATSWKRAMPRRPTMLLRAASTSSGGPRRRILCRVDGPFKSV